MSYRFKRKTIYPTMKEWLFILFGGPILIFSIAMIDVPFHYWFNFSWFEYFTLHELLLMSMPTFLIGWLFGFCLVYLMKLVRA